jgi:hypothetical protein
LLFAVALAAASPFVSAKGGGSHGSYSTGAHGKAAGVQRDAHGHIKRSQEAKQAFKKSHPCPSTEKSSGACPGYVIDHVVPLKRGGTDSPSNMQWQTAADAKAKDKMGMTETAIASLFCGWGKTSVEETR